MGKVIVLQFARVLLLLTCLTSASHASDDISSKRTEWSPPFAPIDGPAISARYQPVPNGYRIVGSDRTFNRVLYGGHTQDDLQTRYYTFAGDQPLFLGSIINTVGGGANAKCGTLMLGVSQSFGVDAPNKYGAPSYGTWFHHCRDSVAIFQNGWWEYHIQPFMTSAPEVKAFVEVFPLTTEDGFLVHLKITPESAMEFCAGFGGITDYLGLVTNQGSVARDFTAANCAGNTVRCGKNRALIEGPKSKMWIGTTFEADFSVGDGKSAVEGPCQFLARNATPSDFPMARISSRMSAGETFEGRVVVLRNADERQLDKWLTRQDPVEQLKRESLARQNALIIETPDSMLNLTIPSNVIGMDACWNQKVFCHGGANWHSPYVGWRCCYGPTVLGWHDRVASHFLTHAHPTRFTIDQQHGDGYISPELQGRGLSYNMQEVAIDMLLNDLDWTGDLKLADEVFERISKALKFESRVFDPDGNGLYQNYLNTWISDGHAYNGGDCSQASAYNYRANRLMASVAVKLGRDPKLFLERAEKIRQAMQQTLWLAEKGLFAEYKDTVGNQLIHPSPELATIYHTIEAGLADQFQAYQMHRFTRSDLRNVRTTPRHGRFVWSSNWYPRIFSACGLFPGENIHLAWAYFQNGQTDEAMELLRGLVDAHFMGDAPGSVGHLLNSTGMSDGSQDFADTVSMYLRLIVEGLFGVRFHLLEDRIEVAPGFPREWNKARLQTQEVTLAYRRSDQVEELDFTCQRPAKRVLRLPMRGTSVSSVTIDGIETSYRVEPRVGRCDVVVETEKVGTVRLRIVHANDSLPALGATEFLRPGDDVKISVRNGAAKESSDPSLGLSQMQVSALQVTGKCEDRIGNHTIFVRVQSHAWDGWLPADLTITSPEIRKTMEPSGTFQAVDISKHFNATLSELHKLDYASPRPTGMALMTTRNGRYAWDDNNLGGARTPKVDESLLRQADGKFQSASGITFQTPQSGVNVACASVWDNFPDEITIPLSGRGTELAILLVGVTNPMQSRVENGRLTVRYADETTEIVKLVNPINFDDWMVAPTQRENETVYLSDYNHAAVQRIRLNQEKSLKSLSVKGVANEVIVGVLGVSLREVSR